MTYHPTEFACKKISSSADKVETVISDYIILHCDLELETSKPVFSYDSLGHDAAPPNKVWLQKVKQLRKYHPDEHSLKFWIFAVTLTTTKQSHIFKRQSTLCHQSKSGCKLINSSGDIVESHNLTIWSLHCDSDLEDSKQVFSFWLMMHHYPKFGNQRFSNSEDTVQTNIHCHVELSLWPWLWTQ